LTTAHPITISKRRGKGRTNHDLEADGSCIFLKPEKNIKILRSGDITRAQLSVYERKPEAMAKIR
jgi:hypothetical protein